MSNLDELIDTLSDDAETVKVAPRPLLISGGWMLAITLYVLVFLGIVGLRDDISNAIQHPLFIIELITVVITIITTAIAASLGAYPDRARSKLATWAPMIPLTLFLGIITFNLILHNAILNTYFSEETMDTGHMGCMGWMCVLSLLPAAGLFLLLSRGICLYPRTAYSHAALAAAMTAYLVLRLEEAYATPMHLILTHILPMIFIIIVASFIARLKIFSPLIKRN